MPNQALQKPLEDYISYWEKLSLRGVRLIEKVADPVLHLSDPFYELRGVDSVGKAIGKALSNVGQFKIKIIDYGWSHNKNTAYVRWAVSYFLPDKAHKQVVEGMSEIIFSKTGKVIGHNNYWDRKSLNKNSGGLMSVFWDMFG